MRLYRLLLLMALVACVAPATAAADSRVTAQIQGPSTLQRGQEAVYTVTIRNAGSQTLGTGSPRLTVDMDALPAAGAQLSETTYLGGTGPWTCGSSAGCTLARNRTFPPGATAAFSFRAKVLRAVTLDFDVLGTEVLFSNLRKAVSTRGTQFPVLYGVLMPPTVSPRAPAVGLTLSEPSRVIVRLERITARYRLSRRVRIGKRIRRVRSLRCADRRPRVRRTTRVRKLRSRCGLGLHTLFTSPTRARGFNLLDVPQLRALPAGRRYRLRLIPRTPDGRQGREARSAVVKTTR